MKNPNNYQKRMEKEKTVVEDAEKAHAAILQIKTNNATKNETARQHQKTASSRQIQITKRKTVDCAKQAACPDTLLPVAILS